jgi:hypothetical protein
MVCFVRVTLMVSVGVLMLVSLRGVVAFGVTERVCAVVVVTVTVTVAVAQAVDAVVAAVAAYGLHASGRVDEVTEGHGARDAHQRD